MYEQLKTHTKVTISEELVNDFKPINASFEEACGLALRQPVAGNNTAYDGRKLQSIWIRINDRQKRLLLFKRKTFAPVAFGSRVFSPSQLKMSIYCKKISCYLPRVSRVLSHPTGNNTADASTHRQQIGNEVLSNKNHPLTLWNAQLPISRIELTPKEKVQLILRDDIVTAPIEINLQLTDPADEEHLFLTRRRRGTEREIFARKTLSKQLSTGGKGTSEPRYRSNRNRQNTTQCDSLRIWSNLRNCTNTQHTGLRPAPEDTEVTLTTRRIRQASLQDQTWRNKSSTHEEIIIVNDRAFMRKYYGEDGTVTHHQILILKHIIPELLSTLHGKMNKHPRITKMIRGVPNEILLPGLARKIRAWIINFPDCIANKRIDTRQIRSKMLSNTEFTFGPEDCLDVDILPILLSSIGYKLVKR